VLSFDNLGEASELERGDWPAGRPLGSHPSVTDALPRLLDELNRNRLHATFFVEAINCEIYPDALTEIARGGHELGLHGWRHESWTQLSPEQERGVLTRGVRAFAGLGHEVRGFRPPGGALNKSTPVLLNEASLDWCSPAGSRFEARGSLAYVPFDWRMVDAYHLMPRFRDARLKRGDPSEAAAPDDLGESFAERLNGLPGLGGAQTLILHPFLMLDPDWFAAVARLLALISELAASGRTWVVAGGEFAAWLR